jgi:Ca2+-binding EF-hand superfamily protein
MLSALQAAKLDRRFELLDYDGDGAISAADFDLAAGNVCKAFDFPQDSVEFERIQTTYNALWVAISRHAPRDAKGRIGREQFVVSCADTLFAEGGYDQTEGRLAQVIFDLVDADGNGVLDVEECATWFSAYGVCEDDAVRAFQRIDRNGDGVLDRDEVLGAIRDYYLSDDPHAPGNWLFGPLTVALPR